MPNTVTVDMTDCIGQGAMPNTVTVDMTNCIGEGAMPNTVTVDMTNCIGQGRALLSCNSRYARLHLAFELSGKNILFSTINFTK